MTKDKKCREMSYTTSTTSESFNFRKIQRHKSSYLASWELHHLKKKSWPVSMSYEYHLDEGGTILFWIFMTMAKVCGKVQLWIAALAKLVMIWKQGLQRYPDLTCWKSGWGLECLYINSLNLLHPCMYVYSVMYFYEWLHYYTFLFSPGKTKSIASVRPFLTDCNSCQQSWCSHPNYWNEMI